MKDGTGATGGMVEASTIGKVHELGNGMVKVRVTESDLGVEQEYLGLDGGSWSPLVRAFQPHALQQPAREPRELQPPGSGDKEPLTIYSLGPGVAEERRFMVPAILRSAKVERPATNDPRLVLTGSKGANLFEQTIMVAPGEKRVHVQVVCTLDDDHPLLEYAWSSFVFLRPGPLDFTHAPTFKRAPDNVLGDRIFFSPAVVMQKAGALAALVPDLDVINGSVVYARDARPILHPRIFAVPVDPDKVSFPTALDLELISPLTAFPLFGYGAIDFIGEQHVFWRHENRDGAFVRRLSSRVVRYAFDLFIDADAPPREGYRGLTRFLWRRYGSSWFRKPRPQAAPLAEYAKLCYPAAFAYRGFRLVSHGGEPVVEHGSPPGVPERETWQQWEHEEVPVGGYRNSAPQWYALIGNTPWWNNARDAVGLFRWGRSLGDDSLVEKARRMVNLALSAPQNGGAFPGLYDLDAGRWIAGHWKPPAEGYDPTRAERYFHADSDVYQAAAMSFTAVNLLKFLASCELNQRILPFVQAYARFLVSRTGADGMVPAWFGPDLRPLPSLRWNAEGGVHAWFLAELHRITGERTWLDAARAIAGALVHGVLPTQKWHDVEAFYSCAVKPETFFEPHTGQTARSALSMPWAIQGMASLHELTGDASWLRNAETVADYGAFYQAVWQPHFIITAYPFGGWSSQTGDAEWLDGRQCEFAGAMVRVGLLAGRQDLLERGVAAARASLTLTNQPRHVANDIYSYPHYPLGIGPENIDHEGFPQKPHRSSAGWNEVSGLTAAADVLHRLGGIHWDAAQNISVGVDGVLVESFERKGSMLHLRLTNLLGRLAVPFDAPYEVELRVIGLPAGRCSLVINDEAPRDVTSEELKSYRLTIR